MKLTILHTNDVHAEYEAWLRCASLIKARRLEIGPESCLVFDAGDHFDMGVNECRLSDGKLHLDLLADLGLDAFTPGNNEFYRTSRDHLTRLTHDDRVPWLLSTVSDLDGSPFAGVKTRLLFERGIKIGVLGALDPMDDAAGILHRLKSLELNKSLAEGAQELRAQGAEIIILISHCGLRDDLEMMEELNDYIDVVVGGHSHSELHEVRQVGKTLIVQAGGFGKYVGELELEIAEGQITHHRYLLHEITPSDPEDAAQRMILDQYRAGTEEVLNKELFVLKEELSHRDMISLLAELMRRKYEADIGIMFGPGTSGGLRAGPVRVRDIYEICQSFITPATFEISGRQIAGLIRERNNPAITAAQGFGIGFRPQGQVFGKLAFSGLTLEGDPDMPSTILVDGQPLDPERWYTAGAITHLYKSDSGGYPSLDGSRNPELTRFRYIRDELVDFFASDDAEELLQEII